VNIYFYDYPIGTIGIAENNGAICRVYINNRDVPPDFAITETPLISDAASQLNDYFTGKRCNFELLLSYSGTDFQRAVWSSLTEIPFGETRSYSDIAESVGNPRACRAVGMANHRNPLPIIIPCHRVVNNNGKLGGYVGGVQAKQYLLDLEKRYDKTALL